MDPDDRPAQRLLVLLGAGASWDCASDQAAARNLDLRPPLVTELFSNRTTFARILHEYPLAEQASADIRAHIASGAISLETFLRTGLRDSEQTYRRRQYWAVPLYLQHLLYAISDWGGEYGGFTGHPDNYDRLINATLRLPEVTFVTLNYDTLLDDRLAIHGQLNSINSYIELGRNWSLIKPHGSVNWGRRLANQITDLQPNDPYLAKTIASIDGDLELSDVIEFRGHNSIAELRGLTGTGMEVTANGMDIYYPALSAPLGENDELVLPPNHLDHIKAVTGHWNALHVLVIGYSGLDQGVLELLNWGGRSIASLTVVSNSPEYARLAAERIMASVRVARLLPEPVSLHGIGFDRFISEGGLDSYVDSLLSRNWGTTTGTPEAFQR